MKSAARCAWLAAVKITRLSGLSTSSQLAMWAAWSSRVAVPSLSGTGGIDGICSGEHVPHGFLAEVGELRIAGCSNLYDIRYAVPDSMICFIYETQCK